MGINELTYQGSKQRLMKVLKPLIENNLDEGMAYIEPFGGGMNSFTPINASKKMANDSNKYNIALWSELKKKGFDAFESEWSEYLNILSNCEDKPNGPNYLKAKELYNDMKTDCLTNGGKYSDALLGFVAYACSFGGSWWNGFIGFNERRGENYIKMAIKNLKKHVSGAVNIENSDFKHGDYDAIEIPDNAFIYCDPPYGGTKQYSNDFDSVAFWEWCRYLLKNRKNIKILVSEYNAPEDFVCIWSSSVQDKMGTNKMSKTEKLFIHNSQVDKFKKPNLSETVKITRDDINDMVQECVRTVLKENGLDELEAWHGTVADFNKFDTNFMGSGEGTQVYGWGVYLTNVKDTGRWYAATIAIDKNTKTDKGNTLRVILNYIKAATFEWKLVHEMKPNNFEKKKNYILGRLDILKNKAARENTKIQIQKAIDYILPANSKEEFNAITNRLTHEVAKGYKRYVLTVEAPDTGYIDWTNNDRAFLQNLFNKISQKFDTSHVDFNSVQYFGDMFEKLRGWVHKEDFKNGEKIPQKDLSLFLKDLGFTGIKVPTGFKHGGDGRGENIIVFDANNVKIVKKQNMAGQTDF